MTVIVDIDFVIICEVALLLEGYKLIVSSVSKELCIKILYSNSVGNLCNLVANRNLLYARYDYF